MRRLLMAAAAIAVAMPAYAAPPPGTDLSSWQHQWFERQYNLAHIHCCEIADGHFLDDNDWRVEGDHYVVFIHGVPHEIKPYMMRDPVVGGANPFGKAIVWYKTYVDGSMHIWCFTPGWES